MTDLAARLGLAPLIWSLLLLAGALSAATAAVLGMSMSRMARGFGSHEMTAVATGFSYFAAFHVAASALLAAGSLLWFLAWVLPS